MISLARKVLTLAAVILSVASLHAADREAVTWSFIPLDEIGARQFVQSHPEWDGRGVVISVLDTGVDMGVEGLTVTSHGEPKVIDVRDFSKQGDVELQKIPIPEGKPPSTLELKDGRRIRNLEGLDLKPLDLYYLAGFLEEKRFANSDVRDLNNDGLTDGSFAVLAFRTELEPGGENAWVAYVDTDGDGEMDDERPVRPYHETHDTFTLEPSGPSPAAGKVLTFALNLFPHELLASLHFDDGGHGTHVAGIAAGYGLHGQKGFNGVAPGAQILSLKIGDNTLSGSATVTGSMKKALEFASDYAREHNVPVVINLSYGIGSELEGRSRIDQVVDKLLVENRLLSASISAGNEGPGISTIGTPAASSLAFTAGAMLSQKTSRVHYGAELPSDIVFLFSSRGGEVHKPDAVAPGSASSTVPPWEKNDLYNGTSMAAPQISGAMALLISAAAHHSPPFSWNSGLLKRAITMTARPLDGYTPLDDGAGVVQVGPAFETLKALADDPEETILVGFQAKTYCPFFPDGSGPAAFWRTGSYLPTNTSPQSFSIRALFISGSDPESRQSFYRAYRLKSTVPWLRTDKTEIYLRGENETAVSVLYDRSELEKPGLYVGAIRAVRKGSKGSVDFELGSTIIVPYGFGPENSYRMETSAVRLEPAGIERFFVSVPPAASSMGLAVRVEEPDRGKARLRVFDPDGRELAQASPQAGAALGPEGFAAVAGDALVPGTWELVLVGDMLNRETVSAEMEVVFSGLQAIPARVERFEEEPGKAPFQRVRILNLYNEPFNGRGNGKILGFQRSADVPLDGEDNCSREFTMDGFTRAVEFEITMEPDTYNLFTDIAVNILDDDGKALVSEGMSYRFITLHVENPAESGAPPAKYTFSLDGAFTNEEDKRKPWCFRLVERHLLRDQQRIGVMRLGREQFTIEPGVKAEMTLTLEKRPVRPPAGFATYGVVELVDSVQEGVRLQVPVLLR